MAHVYRSTEESNRILSKVAQYVADYLASEGFTYTPPTEDGYQHKLVGPNEATLYLRLEGNSNGDRIAVSGGFHIGKGRYGNSEFVRPKSGVPSDISVALARGEKAIAKEINHRYLPKYLFALAEAVVQRDAEQLYTDKKMGNLRHLYNLTGANRTLDAGTRAYLQVGEVYGHIETSDNFATLELRCLTIQQAEAVIKLLKK
jgi:hypothetical protein